MGGVTDPTEHDPNNFRYLVHLDSGILNDDQALPPHSFLIENPSLIATGDRLSASLVDGDHRILWQGTAVCHGFILEAPATSIIATAPYDMYTRGRSNAELAAAHPPQNPDDLLAATSPFQHNEIVVSSEHLRICAIFWVPSDTEDETPISRQQVESMAQATGIHFIELDLVKL